jgi:hypothetical protein
MGVSLLYTRMVCAQQRRYQARIDTGHDAAVGISPIGDLRIDVEDPEKEL